MMPASKASNIVVVDSDRTEGAVDMSGGVQGCADRELVVHERCGWPRFGYVRKVDFRHVPPGRAYPRHF